MQSIHAQTAEPTVLATARPQDGAGVMSVAVARGLAVAVSVIRKAVLMDDARSNAWGTPAAGSTKSSRFAGDSSKPLTCDRTHHIGGGLQDRIEVRPA